MAIDSEPLRNYVPDLSEWVHLDRKWLCDVLYTLDTDVFQRQIESSLTKRRKVVQVKTKDMVGIRSEFAAALAKSVVCSHSKTCLSYVPIDAKGRSAVFIAKGPNKKRKWADFEAVQKESGELKDDKWSYLQKVKRIRTEHSVMQAVLAQLREQNPDLDLHLTSILD
jgi:hypothetical protein